MEVDWALVAEALPGYDLGDELGRGASGVVRAGRHRSLDRDVAIKVVAGPPAAPGARRRFLDEAQLLASFDHPHLVPVFDFVEAGDQLVLVMERLDRTVGDLVAVGVGAPEACAVVLSACAGLQYAHERGVLHRDVKPENLLLNADSVVKVGDFGIAKLIGADAGATVTGVAVGTPTYMAPEQVTGGPLTPATDVYGLGCVLYELLSGERPHVVDDGDDPVGALMRRVTTPASPLRTVAPGVPTGLAEVVDRSLALQPDDRPPSARRLGRELSGAASSAWGPDWVESTGHRLVAPGDLLDLPPGRHESPAGPATQEPTRVASTLRARRLVIGAAVAAVVSIAAFAVSMDDGGDGGEQTDDAAADVVDGDADNGPGEREAGDFAAEVMDAWARGRLAEITQLLTPGAREAMEALDPVDPAPVLAECSYTTGVVRTCSFDEVGGEGAYLVDVARGLETLKIISFERVVWDS